VSRAGCEGPRTEHVGLGGLSFYFESAKECAGSDTGEVLFYIITAIF